MTEAKDVRKTLDCIDALKALIYKFRIGVDNRPADQGEQYVRGFRDACAVFVTEGNAAIQQIESATAEQLRDVIGSAQEPFRRLGEHLSGVLSFDEWKTAARIVLDALISVAPIVSAEPQFTASMYGSPAAAINARDAWRAAQSEPRAAEGAGTYTPVGNGNIDCCECGETYSAHTNGACPTPSAAAAVTAGGDAEIVRLRAVIERDRRTFADCVEAMHRVINQHSWMVDSRGSYEWDDKRYQDEFGEALTNIRVEVEKLAARARDMSDSPSSEAERREARTAPAPRGGLTEAMREFVETLLIDLSNGGGVNFKADTPAHASLTELCTHFLSTAPALPCGHHMSLAINSAEDGRFLYCDLCDAKSGRRDAEHMERELRATAAAAVPAAGDAAREFYLTEDKTRPGTYVAWPVEAFAVQDDKSRIGFIKVSTAPAPKGVVTEAMVNRFLSWPLPDSVHPDGTYPAGDFRKKFTVSLSGTNLLDATEARAMLEHVLQAPPAAQAQDGGRP